LKIFLSHDLSPSVFTPGFFKSDFELWPDKARSLVQTAVVGEGA